MNKLIPSCDVITYVLGLEDGCVYVGKTANLKHRLTKHFTGSKGAAAWCLAHKPIEVKGLHSGDKEKELYYKCCKKYGSDKVRGWYYVHTDLQAPYLYR